MAKRPQSGDVDIHFGRIFTCSSAPALAERPIFDGIDGKTHAFYKAPEGKSRKYAYILLSRNRKTRKLNAFYTDFAGARRPVFRTWPPGRAPEKPRHAQISPERPR